MFWGEALFTRGVQLACSQCRSYRTMNPGLGRRLKIFKQSDPEPNGAKLTEKDFDESEVDIMNSSALVEEYDREHRKISKRIAFHRVEREYFDKPKLPNFLLWSEKEQIRQLHHSEPDKWTYEALSQSFPATPDIIKKIVKAQWKLKDPQRRKKHDDYVKANWKALVSKKLDLPHRIAEHLSKFTARDRLLPAKESEDLQEQQKSTQDKLVPTKCTQFIDIVRKQKEPTSADIDNVKYDISGEEFLPLRPSETYVIGGRVSKRLQSDHFTLSEMRKGGVVSQSVTKPEATVETAPVDEKVSSDSTAESAIYKKSKGVVNPVNVDSFSIPRYSNASSSVTAPNDEPAEDVPLRITIPKDKWKKGAVYKVNNCFYADDGEFLYKI